MDTQEKPASEQRSKISFRRISPVGGNKTRARAEGGGKNRPFYRPLATHFRHDGFDYRQTARDRDAAIFEQSKNGRVRAFEVIRIRRRNGFEIDGRIVEAAECYPRSEDWGAHAWSLPDHASALTKLMQVAQEEKQKPIRLPTCASGDAALTVKR